jgi:bifunctional non-homologous end joining protein LigD
MAAKTRSGPVAGIAITHPERVMYPDIGVTKLDVARYYEEVAAAMLPHLRGRPLTLVRCPLGLQPDAGGGCVYMKHGKVWARGPLRRVMIQEKTKVGEYLIVDDLPALIALAQMDILEIHTWNTTDAHVELPDRIVIDLDPGPEVGWTEVVEGAALVRGALAALGLRSWVKTTGGKGLHVVAPLAPERDWSQCFSFAKGLAQAIVRQRPDRYTIRIPKAGREALILIDYLRNNRTNTSVSAFSTRARPGAPVSAPVAWEDLGPGLDPRAFTVRTMPERLRARRADPWKDYWTARQRLDDDALRAVADR